MRYRIKWRCRRFGTAYLYSYCEKWKQLLYSWDEFES